MKAAETTRLGAHVVGVAIIDSVGQADQTIGIAAREDVRSQLSDSNWIEDLRVRRLLPVSIDGRSYIALLCPMQSGDLIIYSESQSDEVVRFLTSVEFAYDVLNHFLTEPHEAIMVVDKDDRVAYYSPVHERFFGLEPGQATGRLTKEIAKDSRLHEVIRSGKAEIGSLVQVRGTERVVSRIPIMRSGKTIGAIARVMFKSPQQLEELSKRINHLEKEVEVYKREAAAAKRSTFQIGSLIGESAAMRRLRQEILKVAPLDASVLITGESGTGKELVAHSLHAMSPRQGGPLVLVNAAALPATLVEAELFGYEPGAFTGADRKGRKGKFELAANGSIFLDEIGDMPIDIQVKLLRVLQDKAVQRVGGDFPRETDFRLISATNCDLHRLINEHSFRLDLYYRIASIVIRVPPLRERLEDIPLLAKSFLSEIAQRHCKQIPEITDEAINYLCNHQWPGNIRQLRHELERAFFFSENGKIDADDFSLEISSSTIAMFNKDVKSTSRLKDVLSPIEDDAIIDAMKRHKGNKKRVAEELGVSRSYLYKKLASMR